MNRGSINHVLVNLHLISITQSGRWRMTEVQKRLHNITSSFIIWSCLLTTAGHATYLHKMYFKIKKSLPEGDPECSMKLLCGFTQCMFYKISQERVFTCFDNADSHPRSQSLSRKTAWHLSLKTLIILIQL